MRKHLTKLSALLLVLLFISCDPNSYITKKQYFKNEYTLATVEAPDFPFPDDENISTINISFPKQDEFKLEFSNTSCGGNYEATTEGAIKFTRTNCSSACCETEWDEYILTLLRKVESYDGGDDSKLTLYIDDSNYLVLETYNKPIISTP
ncbi:hypothetical protein [Carboxylicivirga sp. RSCT41]|uniref:hypothetical protein n=1 Tax=Carboxylicivirga agarovorans TaxID=3417570 RepID=UPI003D32D8D6